MFRKRSASLQSLEAFDRVEGWIRARYGLAAGDIVLVSEDRTRLPGFPERETRAVFWKGDERYRLRVFKPPAEVAASDLPPAFLLGTMRDDGEFECC